MRPARGLTDEFFTEHYKYRARLTVVTSNFPDEGNVTYEYGGDGSLRNRTEGGSTTTYNGFSAEDNSGNLITTEVHAFATIDGSNPNTGTYTYEIREGNSSVREIINGGNTIGEFRYSPFGSIVHSAGVSRHTLFHGLLRDAAGGVALTEHRVYDPAINRWLTREPSGAEGPNLYWYASANPIGNVDNDGLSSSTWLDWFGGTRGDRFDRFADCVGRWNGTTPLMYGSTGGGIMLLNGRDYMPVHKKAELLKWRQWSHARLQPWLPHSKQGSLSVFGNWRRLIPTLKGGPVPRSGGRFGRGEELRSGALAPD